MRRTWMIWLFYALGLIGVFMMSSCSSSRPKYVAKSGPVKAPMENKKRQTIVQMHIIGLITTAWILHALED